MYKDFLPPLEGGMTAPTPVVAVITRNERVRPEAVISVCRRYGATSLQSEGLCFWVVFEDEPKRAWPMTEACVRNSVDKDGYIKCRSYDPGDKRDRGEEVPDYLRGARHINAIRVWGYAVQSNENGNNGRRAERSAPAGTRSIFMTG